VSLTPKLAVATALLVTVSTSAFACQVSRPMACPGCAAVVHIQVSRGKPCGIAYFHALTTVRGGRLTSKPRLGRAGFRGQTGTVAYYAGQQTGTDSFGYQIGGRDHLNRPFVTTVAVEVRITD